MTEMLVVKSKLKELSGDCNVGGDVADALNNVANHLVDMAATRAKANGRKTVQAKDSYVGKNEAKTMLVVKSKVKDCAKGCNVSGNFAEALNENLCWMFSQAFERAKANGRKTVRGVDF